MKKLSAGFATPLVVVVVCLIVGISITFAYFQFKSKQASQTPATVETSSPKISPATQAQSDETASWKAYTSGEVLKKINIRFALKYPTNWSTNEENPNHTSGVPWVVFSEQPVKDVMSRTSACFSVGGGIWSTTTTMDNFVKDQDSAEILSPSGKMESTAPKVLSTENVAINEASGLKRKVIKYNESEPSWQVFLKTNANTTYGSDGMNFYILESCPSTDDVSFNKILSTFKFL